MRSRYQNDVLSSAIAAVLLPVDAPLLLQTARLAAWSDIAARADARVSGFGGFRSLTRHAPAVPVRTEGRGLISHLVAIGPSSTDDNPAAVRRFPARALQLVQSLGHYSSDFSSIWIGCRTGE